ncbi:MAG: hypothetical protein ACREEM_24815 [Blastocatellia bacterium]
MSKEELQKSFDAAIAKPAITPEDRVKAAKFIFERANAEEIECALAGSIAMSFYDCSCLSQDLTILASGTLGLEPASQLRFGGERYSVLVGGVSVPVDVIVRKDHLCNFYTAALNEAKATTDGLRVISPEWLVVLKFLAGSSEDRFDLLVLLSKPGLVNREKITQLIEQVDGKLTAHLALIGLKPIYLQADMIRAHDDN